MNFDNVHTHTRARTNTHLHNDSGRPGNILCVRYVWDKNRIFDDGFHTCNCKSFLVFFPCS